MACCGGVSYTYLANSNLISTVKHSANPSVYATHTRQYDPYRNLIDYIDNSYTNGGTTVPTSKFDYTNDALGRRTDVVRTGAAFAIVPPNEGFHDDFGYNGRSELTGVDRFEWTQAGGKGTALTSLQDFDFNYDSIGNRTDTAIDGVSKYFCTNTTNEYTFTDNNAATCPPNAPAETFTYDIDGDGFGDDGCMTDDGTFDYVWNLENRLVKVETDDKRLTFTYDYMGRRVQKVYATYDGSTWQTQTDQRFVYDGWNVILVLDGEDSNATLMQYTWGLDLSGTFHGAGGVSGLLASHDPTNGDNVWYQYDANGNVSELLDFVGGLTPTISLAAHYEYDAFGNLLAAVDVDSSNTVNENPYRFSTKWLDTELAATNQNGAIATQGLYYYGYRYYSSALGRWMSRDPIQERGGLNLYAFVANGPIDKIDPLGLDMFRDLSGGLSPDEFVIYCACREAKEQANHARPDPISQTIDFLTRSTTGAGGVSTASLALGGPFNNAFGVNLNASMVMGTGVSGGLVGAFFPDSCEVGLFSVVTPGANVMVASTIPPSWTFLFQQMALGVNVGASLTGELAVYFGAGVANASSYAGPFSSITGGGGPIAVGAFWGGGWAGVNIGPGVSLPIPQGAWSPQYYSLVYSVTLPDCLCSGMIAAAVIP